MARRPIDAESPRLERITVASRSRTARRAGAEVVEIERAAHFMFYDNPAATFRAVGELVERLR